MAEQVASRIDIDVRGGDTAERAAAALDRLVVSEGKAVSGSDALTASTDKQSKVRERSEAGLERLARRRDAEYRAVQQLIKDQRDLDRAYEAGLGSTQAYAVALEALRQKRIQLGSAMNDNAPAAMTARLTEWARDANSMTGRLDLWSKTQNAATNDVETHTKAVGLQRYELINLSRQFQDIGVSLAGGQAPLTVLVQQGSQVADIFGSSNAGAGAALKSFGQTVLRFALNPITLLTAGFGAAALAAYQFSQQQAALERSLNGVGRLSGASAAGLRQMAADASRAPGGPSYGQAISGAAEFASAGISAQNIPTLLADVTRFSHAFGVDMDAAQKEIAQIVGESGLGAFERRFGPVSFATKEMVRSLEASGRFAESAALKTRMFDEETRKAADSASNLQKAWESIVKWATTPVFGIGGAVNRALNGPSLQEQLAVARGEFFNLRAQRRGDHSSYPGETAAEQRVRELERRLQEERDRPAREARNLELNRLSNIAGPAIDAARPDLAQLRGLKESRDALQSLLGSDDGLAKLGDRAGEAREALATLNGQIEAWRSSVDQLRFTTDLSVREITARTFSEREAVAMERARTQAIQEGKSALYASVAAEAERAKMMAESAKKVDDLVRTSADNARLARASNPLERRLMEIEFQRRDFMRENIPNAAAPMAAHFDTAGAAATRLADALTSSADRIGRLVSLPEQKAATTSGMPFFARSGASLGGEFYRSIMRAEGTDKFGDPYNTSLGYMRSPKPLVEMTMAESLAWGDQVRRAQGLNSSAKGAFQITNTTQRDAMRALGLGDNDLFSVENQNRMADWIFKTQGIGAWEGFKRHGAALPATNDNRASRASGSFDQNADTANYESRIKPQEDFAKEIILGNDALQARVSVLGMNQRAIDEATKHQELMNEAIRQTGGVLPEQKQWIETNAKAWADYQENLRQADKAQREYVENLDIARSGVSGSMSGALKALANGENVGQALNQALTGVRDRIFDTMSSRFSEALLGPMGSASGGILGSIFGFGGGQQNVGTMSVNAGLVNVNGGAGGIPGVGGVGGGFLGGIIDKIGSFFNSIGQNADGTENWRGGLTWVGERGPELLNLPRGSQITSSERSMAFVREQASAARAHAAAIAMNDNRGSAPTVVSPPVTVNLIGAPQGTEVKETSDGKGGRRIDVVIAERVAAGMASPQGRQVMAGMGVRQRLARM
jgi:hypothetical protein